MSERAFKQQNIVRGFAFAGEDGTVRVVYRRKEHYTEMKYVELPPNPTRGTTNFGVCSVEDFLDWAKEKVFLPPRICPVCGCRINDEVMATMTGEGFLPETETQWCLESSFHRLGCKAHQEMGSPFIPDEDKARAGQFALWSDGRFRIPVTITRPVASANWTQGKPELMVYFNIVPPCQTEEGGYMTVHRSQLTFDVDANIIPEVRLAALRQAVADEQQKGAGGDDEALLANIGATVLVMINEWKEQDRR